MFYKYIKDELVCGNYVYGNGYTLTPANKTVEIDGWKWFDTDEQAKVINKDFDFIDPADLTSNFFEMFGLGKTLNIVPHKGGNIKLSISFNPTGVGSELNNYRIAYGIGSPPPHGTPAIGVFDDKIYSGDPVSEESIIIVKNIIIKIPCWFDIQGMKNNSNISVGIKNIKATIQEL